MKQLSCVTVYCHMEFTTDANHTLSCTLKTFTIHCSYFLCPQDTSHSRLPHVIWYSHVSSTTSTPVTHCRHKLYIRNILKQESRMSCTTYTCYGLQSHVIHYSYMPYSKDTCQMLESHAKHYKYMPHSAIICHTIK